ncbi:MAG: hypothetical protein JST04_09340 [Bdellovibrionales bacterium]|nr:hypothetical protein [Bdellovibrionales bacterium]
MSSAAPARLDRPDFRTLVALRREWRTYHERQDRENADRVFREAGVDSVGDLDLKFFPQVFRAKLNEFGRDWERALAAQALREGFSFYRLPLTIEVESVNALHAWIETALERDGAPLFFESNGVHALADGAWDAIFYFTFRGDTAGDPIGFAAAPGVKAAAKVLKIL